MRDGILAPGELRAVNDEDDLRLLRRLDIREGETGVGGRVDTVIGVVVDVETTGIGDEDVVIELALRRFRADPDGVIVKIDRAYSWLEDPGRDLPEDIVRLTGLTDADVAGQVIDDDAAVRLLRSADFVCAHNAKFDRAYIERRLPEAAGLPWTCSCSDIDWRASGFDGKSLGWLLAQVGYFHGAHRAGDDVDAVIALLRHPLRGGGTALSEMLATARSLRAGASGRLARRSSCKDALRARGYRWDSGHEDVVAGGARLEAMRGGMVAGRPDLLGRTPTPRPWGRRSSGSPGTSDTPRRIDSRDRPPIINGHGRESERGKSSMARKPKTTKAIIPVATAVQHRPLAGTDIMPVEVYRVPGRHPAGDGPWSAEPDKVSWIDPATGDALHHAPRH